MKNTYTPEGFIELFTPSWRPNPECLQLWDGDTDWLRLNDTVYADEINDLIDDCDGYLPCVSKAMLTERMRTLAAQVTGFDEIDKRFPDPPWYEAPGYASKAKAGWGAAHHQRALKYHCEVGLTPREWQDVLEAYGSRCVYCRARGKLQIDHVVPMSRRGAHLIDNVVPACGPCNFSKRAKSLAAWLEERTDLDARAIFGRMAGAKRSIELALDAYRRAA